MKLDFNENKEVVVLLGAGSMGTAIVERIAHGKKIFLGDINKETLENVKKKFEYNGYDVETQIVDATNQKSIEEFAQRASELGKVMYFIDTAGASPSQASPEFILKLDLWGTAVAIDEFGKIIARGGAGLIISSQTGYMLQEPLDSATENALALTPTNQLLDLPCLGKEKITNSGIAYIISKKANHLRVRTAAATSWGEKGARINTISPGVIVTPLAYDEFNSAGNSYQEMIESSPVKRAGSSDEIATASSFLLSSDASFITGTDLLIDGGVIAAIKSGKYKLEVR